jgi:hypothetical protein
MTNAIGLPIRLTASTVGQVPTMSIRDGRAGIRHSEF